MSTLQDQQIIQRDFFYSHPIRFANCIAFAALSLAYNAAVYYIIQWICIALTTMFGPIESTVVLQVLITLPLSAVVPTLLVFRYIRNVVPRFYSLSDGEEGWRKKALQLIMPGEAFRFLLGLLPEGFLQYGVISSPLTYRIFSRLYVNPTGRFDVIMTEKSASITDWIVFLIVYLAYYGIYEFLLLRKMKHEVHRHCEYLRGTMDERKYNDWKYKV